MAETLGKGTLLVAPNDRWRPSGLVVAKKHQRLLFGLTKRAALAPDRDDALSVYPLPSASSPTTIGLLRGGVDALAVTADGDSFFGSGMTDGHTEALHFFALPTCEVLQTLVGFDPSAGHIVLASFSSDHRFLLLGVRQGRSKERLLLFDLPRKSILHEIDTDGAKIEEACFSPDGQTILVRLAPRSALSRGMEEIEQEFRLFDLRDDRLRKRSFGRRSFPGYAHKVAFLPDQTAILIAFEAFARLSRDAHALVSWIEIVDLKGSSQGRFQHTDPFWLCSTFLISDDGKTLLTGSGDRVETPESEHPYQIDRWDLASGDILASSAHLPSPISYLALSPDSSTILAASEDASLRSFSFNKGDAKA